MLRCLLPSVSTRYLPHSSPRAKVPRTKAQLPESRPLPACPSAEQQERWCLRGTKARVRMCSKLAAEITRDALPECRHIARGHAGSEAT